MTLQERVDRIVNLLDSKKAEEIEVFDLGNVDYIAKQVILANSLGGKHTQALFDNMKEELKPQGETFYGSDESDEWIVADLGEIIVHIMTPNYRQRYSLEEFLDELKSGKLGGK
ncbi:ribosome silencing factor [Nitratifractor salsuginis]|uniref:Ribosomal silencing factor RsfS n=1 Tax=Nitratifractor salsuginis (strain DSM 16511 / JCM 12458 / E9I37-1) TaxID=749222 RepID=E6WZ07_NITSE|nr:ribosome silencing factor [Nitratifractor salsuginis]ADV45457.1 iojap-like protein [Nitratifractor salsuginis DSM 16511]